MNSKAEYNQPEIRLLQKATQRRKNSKASWSKTTLQQTFNRETVSTSTTNLLFRPCKPTKVSQFITSEPKPANFYTIFSNPYDSKKYSLYYVSEAIRASN
jgi:hypothetical protein